MTGRWQGLSTKGKTPDHKKLWDNLMAEVSPVDSDKDYMAPRRNDFYEDQVQESEWVLFIHGSQPREGLGGYGFIEGKGHTALIGGKIGMINAKYAFCRHRRRWTCNQSQVNFVTFIGGRYRIFAEKKPSDFFLQILFCYEKKGGCRNN